MNSDPLSRSISGQLLMARISLGWTQAQVAEESGLNDATVARFEKNSAPLKLRNFIRLTEVLGLDPHAVLDNALEAQSALSQDSS